MSSQLLPPNATALERAVADTFFQSNSPPITELWDPKRCPLALLPYLAWARSVDHWDPSWPEATKRAMVSDAFYIHQHKGTLGALKRVLAPFGVDFKIIEWWQTVPKGPLGTFSITLSIMNRGISEATYFELQRLIDDAKPISRFYSLTIAIKLLGYCPMKLGYFDGDLLLIRARLGPINDPEIPWIHCMQLGYFDGDVMTIYPINLLQREV